MFPNSKKEEIIKTGEKSFKIRVKVKPMRGEVNGGVTNILVSYFKIPPSKLKLIKGFRERNKIFQVKLEK